MARPVKWRKIEQRPKVPCFIPVEDEKNEYLKNVLKLEELEAIRLKDLEGLEQGECAIRMEVSRPTFQRILISAREKVADSLVNGKGICIQGGNFTQYICKIKCMNCGHEQTESYENFESVKIGEYLCSECGSENVICVNHQGSFCNRHCRNRGKNGLGKGKERE